MAELIYIKTQSNLLDGISIFPGQLIYVTDTDDLYLDRTGTVRAHLYNIQYCETIAERNSVTVIQVDKFYLVEESDALYKFDFDRWVTVISNLTVENLSVEPMLPVTLQKNGDNISPRTLYTSVYDSTGRDLTEVIRSLETEGKVIKMITSSINLYADHNNQRLFTIQYPYEGYDVNRYPIMVLLNDKQVPYEDFYVVGNQLVFQDPADTNLQIKTGDKITVVFHYLDIKENSFDDVNATTVNGVRMFFQIYEPIDRKEGDIWFDIVEKTIKRFDGSKWVVIVQGNPSGASGVDIYRETMQITDSRTYIDLPWSPITVGYDALLVFQDNKLLAEGLDYIIDSSGTRIIAIDETWMGTVEDPTVFNLILFRSRGGGIHGDELIDGSINLDKLEQSLQDLLALAASLDFDEYYMKEETEGLLEVLRVALQNDIDKRIKTSDIVNNVTSNSTIYPLSAAQGKALNDKIDSSVLALTGLIGTAKSTADSAVTAAGNAQTTANKGVQDAATAQSTANSKAAFTMRTLSLTWGTSDTVNLTISGYVPSTMLGFIDLAASNTDDVYKTAASANIRVSAEYSGYITLKALGTLPPNGTVIKFTVITGTPATQG
jgi:hypothetical protein